MDYFNAFCNAKPAFCTVQLDECHPNAADAPMHAEKPLEKQILKEDSAVPNSLFEQLRPSVVDMGEIQFVPASQMRLPKPQLCSNPPAAAALRNPARPGMYQQPQCAEPMDPGYVGPLWDPLRAGAFMGAAPPNRQPHPYAWQLQPQPPAAGNGLPAGPAQITTTTGFTHVQPRQPQALLSARSTEAEVTPRYRDITPRRQVTPRCVTPGRNDSATMLSMPQGAVRA
mmetsp:Transcript_28693/g.52258  ORF Transcript_28693/g.52258 Transcript_28693/m.52258 type:complete len:227 (+) Transcript_28693:84-764(+)